MKDLKYILEAGIPKRFKFSNNEKFWGIAIDKPENYKTCAWINWHCPDIINYLVKKYPNCCTLPESNSNKYKGLRVYMSYGEDVWGSPFWGIHFQLIGNNAKDNQRGGDIQSIKASMLIKNKSSWKEPAKIVRQTLEYLSNNLDALDRMFELANNTEVSNKTKYDNLLTLSDIQKVKGSTNFLKEFESTNNDKNIVINKKTFDTLRNEFKKGHYGIVDRQLFNIIKEYGKKGYNQIGIHLGKSKEYTWNHYISDIYIHDNKPNEIHLNVYWQGDSTDGDEVLTFMDYCSIEEQELKFGREYFRLYRDEILDVINRLENIILKS